MVSPPAKLTSEVLAAAQISGVDRIFRAGGAQAVAALAFGTKSIPKVDKIVGPGNKYVQKAKHILSDIVGIDMIAGPSEIAIIADETSDADLIAVDLMAQTEHAHDACGFLITSEAALIENVKEKLESAFLERVKFIKTESLRESVDKANEIAPEHLQLVCSKDNNLKLIPEIRNAGAVFIGQYTPVPVGDYWAGPSHTLPTGKTAKFQEGLGVRSFIKKVSFIENSHRAMKRTADKIGKFALLEGMEFHRKSVLKRKEK